MNYPCLRLSVSSSKKKTEILPLTTNGEDCFNDLFIENLTEILSEQTHHRQAENPPKYSKLNAIWIISSSPSSKLKQKQIQEPQQNPREIIAK